MIDPRFLPSLPIYMHASSAWSFRDEGIMNIRWPLRGNVLVDGWLICTQHICPPHRWASLSGHESNISELVGNWKTYEMLWNFVLVPYQPTNKDVRCLGTLFKTPWELWHTSKITITVISTMFVFLMWAIFPSFLPCHRWDTPNCINLSGRG